MNPGICCAEQEAGFSAGNGKKASSLKKGSADLRLTTKTFIDLVLYNRFLRYYVLIDFKVNDMATKNG